MENDFLTVLWVSFFSALFLSFLRQTFLVKFFLKTRGRAVYKIKTGYTPTPVACGWAGAITEVSGTFGQEQ